MIVDGNVWNGIVSPGETTIEVANPDLTNETISQYASIIKDLSSEYRGLLDASPTPRDLVPHKTPSWAVPELDSEEQHSPLLYVPGGWDPLPESLGPLTFFSLWAAYTKLPAVQRASRRVYRAALMMGFQHLPGIDAASALNVLASTRYHYEGCGEPPPKWRKLRGLPQKDSEKLFKALRQSRSLNARIAGMWLQAGMMIGVRPGEWRQTRVLRSHAGLPSLIEVINAKHTHGRAPGEVRQLEVTHFKQEERELLRDFLEICQQNNQSKETWDRFYSGCRRALQRANSALWPRRTARITLYSARHAFSSRAKKSRTRIETAALMGHRSDRTAAIHYGKKASTADGREMSVPRATGDAVSLVVSTEEPRLPRNPHTTVRNQ